MDISDTSLLLSTPIFQDSLRAVGQRHSNYTQKKLLLNRQILKLILLITACKPASLQEHKTYSHALWDESEKFSFKSNENISLTRLELA